MLIFHTVLDFLFIVYSAPTDLADICTLSELNSHIPVHFSSLIPRMSTFTLAISFDHFQFALIHGPNIPGSYAVLLFTASDLASIISDIRNWVLFLLWLHPFILWSYFSTDLQ